MNYSRHLEHLFLAGVLGAVSLGVSSLDKLSSKVGELTKSVIEFNGKFDVVTEKMMKIEESQRDHEVRIRYFEKRKGG